MKLLLLNYVLAFAEGFALIISPCILPILPIILSGSITGDKRRPLGVVTGFVIMFALFTLLSHAIVQLFHWNLEVVRQIAFLCIALFGVILISDALSEKFSRLTQGLANFGGKVQTRAQGFAGGLLLGSLVSLVWAPCGGPILASAIIQSAIQDSTWHSFLIFLSFALGSIIPMLFIIWMGRRLIDRLGFLKTRGKLLRKLFGLIIIVTAILSAQWRPSTDYAPMPAAPNVVLTGYQNNQLVNPLPQPYTAPDFKDITAWLNSPPLNMAALKGKVVLIDFWTYSCINCVRTLPHLKSWYVKYHQKGLVIVGVHAPEFEFEKNLSNVREAVIRDGIQYPVALDNQYGTWTNYDNRYWPAHYLIDRNGKVIYEHFGEGAYAETEHNIQVLLGLQDTPLSKDPPINVSAMLQQTPETYLGYARAANFASPESMQNDQIHAYSFPGELAQNNWALQGNWTIQAESITAASALSAIKLHFYAKQVFMVMGSEHHPIAVKVLLNGKPIATNGGIDVHDSSLTLQQHTLYQVVNLPTPIAGIVELQFNDPGAQLYTFTFSQ